MVVNLSGHWRYIPEDNSEFIQPGYDDSTWKTMFIPSNWFLGGLDHHGVVWFRHEFRHRRSEGFSCLHCDGVDYDADVYLNGEFLGHHAGYFEPFSFNVTDFLRPGKNTLAVRVESPYEQVGQKGWHLNKRLIKGILNHHDCRPGGGWDPAGQSYNTGGIWNRVYLEKQGALTIDSLLLRADMDSDPPILHAKLTMRNLDVKRRARLELRCVPENFKGKIQTSFFSLDIPEGESLHSIQMPVSGIHLWQPWDRGFPHLYEISASLVIAKEIVSRSSLFGFRTVKVEPGFRWFVNGQSYFPRGSNYIPTQWLAEALYKEVASGKDHPFGGSVGENLFSRDVTLARDANLNLLRVHAHVLPPEFHKVCDRAGMLVWQDFPLQWGYSDEPEFRADAVRQMRAMITGLYNHPSIIAWCCHNESPWDAPWMAAQSGLRHDPAHNRDLDASLESVVHELDPSRYVHRNSGTGDGHVYPGWYEGHWRDFKNAPGAPFITDYGAQGLPGKASVLRMLPQFGPDAGHSELVRYKNWLDSQKRIGAVTKILIKLGTILWNFTERKQWKHLQEWMKGWGIKIERSAYHKIPSVEKTPEGLRLAREVWETWRFHDFQPAETFDNGISPGGSLDEFIANSQSYQGTLIQYATECYRRLKYSRVTGIIQFDFIDPWPSVTWSVVDYWRTPKPAYNSLRRSMQPVLPCFQLPGIIEAWKANMVSFCVVNDLQQVLPGCTCLWRLEGNLGDIASASFPLTIPADSVSREVKITLPSLMPGQYKLSVNIMLERDLLGENWYAFTAQQSSKK